MSAASWKEEAQYCDGVARAGLYPSHCDDPRTFLGYTRMQMQFATEDGQHLAAEVIRAAGVLAIARETLACAVSNMEAFK